MKRFPLYFYAVASIAVAIAAVAMTSRTPATLEKPMLGFRHCPLEAEMEDWTPADLRNALGQRGLRLYLVPESEGQPIHDFAYMLLPRTPAPERPLLMAKAHAGKWTGMVHCRKTRDDTHDCILSQEREHTLKVGPYLFFGDPEMLSMIARALGAK